MTHLWVVREYGTVSLSPEHEITPPEAALAKFGRFTMENSVNNINNNRLGQH